MKINENTKWGELDKDLEMLDNLTVRFNKDGSPVKPKPAVMGYRKDDIPGGDIGGDIEPEYTANGEINPFHGTDDTAHISSSNRTLVYWKDAFEEKVRENVRLEDRIKVLRMELDAVKSMVDQAIKYKRGL